MIFSLIIFCTGGGMGALLVASALLQRHEAQKAIGGPAALLPAPPWLWVISAGAAGGICLLVLGLYTQQFAGRQGPMAACMAMCCVLAQVSAIGWVIRCAKPLSMAQRLLAGGLFIVGQGGATILGSILFSIILLG